jgi:acyl carrier protein
MSPTRQRAVLEALAEVAPELDEATLDVRRPFREQLDLDSIDFLRFVVALSKKSGADIPERDYLRLTTVESCAQYLDEAPAAK